MRMNFLLGTNKMPKTGDCPNVNVSLYQGPDLTNYITFFNSSPRASLGPLQDQGLFSINRCTSV